MQNKKGFLTIVSSIGILSLLCFFILWQITRLEQEKLNLKQSEYIVKQQLEQSSNSNNN